MCAQIAASIIRKEQSDVIQLVVDEEQMDVVERVRAYLLDTHDIRVVHALTTADARTLATVTASPVKIVLALVSPDQLRAYVSSSPVRADAAKLWIVVASDGTVDKLDRRRLLPNNTDTQIVLLQPHQNDLTEFKNYFLGVVKNNYAAYSLLAAYMQQTYNCTLVSTAGYVDCSQMTSTVMSANYVQVCSMALSAHTPVQADHTESIVMAAYTLAALGKMVAESKEDVFKWYEVRAVRCTHSYTVNTAVRCARRRSCRTCRISRTNSTSTIRSRVAH